MTTRASPSRKCGVVVVAVMVIVVASLEVESAAKRRRCSELFQVPSGVHSTLAHPFWFSGASPPAADDLSAAVEASLREADAQVVGVNAQLGEAILNRHPVLYAFMSGEDEHANPIAKWSNEKGAFGTSSRRPSIPLQMKS